MTCYFQSSVHAHSAELLLAALSFNVYFDPAACNEHLPLSFAASTQSQASTRLPAISTATPYHVSASN